MNWIDLTRRLADLVVHTEPGSALSVAVFSADDSDRESFCQATKQEVDLLLPDEGVRIDVDLRQRQGEWVWSSALCGLVDGVGRKMVERGGAPGGDSPGYRAFHDLSIVERAVTAARKAAEGTREKIPSARILVSEAGEALKVAEQRRLDVDLPSTNVAEEVAQRDPELSMLLSRCRTLSVVLRVGEVHPHVLEQFGARIGGPHKQFWRAARFAFGTGGLWVLLGVMAVAYGGVLAWELLPVTDWLGPKVDGVDMRPVAALISWLTGAIVLAPGYRRVILLRSLAKKGAKRWKKAALDGRAQLDADLQEAGKNLATSEKRLDSLARIGATEEQKVAELLCGVGLGGFIARLLNAQGGSMERWARTFDGARLDIEKAIGRLNADPASPVRRVVAFIEGIEERSDEPTDMLAVLRYLGTLKGCSFVTPLDAHTLREAANAQQENPRIEKALMFMASDAREFVALLPPQEALDRSFQLGVFPPSQNGDPASASKGLPSGPLPDAVRAGAAQLAKGMSAIAGDSHHRRRLVEALRWVRCCAGGMQRAALGRMEDGAPGENDVQAVMVLASVLLGHPDHAKAFLDRLAKTTDEQFGEFINKDLRPETSTGKGGEDPPIAKADADAWMGLCRRLLQSAEHTPGAQSVELLRRWTGLVGEVAGGSMPLVYPLPPVPPEEAA